MTKQQSFHPGELAVQERAGVREMASRVGQIIGATISPAEAAFMRAQQVAVISAADASGRVWASLLTGAPGFLETINESTLRVHARPTDGDPLAATFDARSNNGNGDDDRATLNVGLLVIEFATRRRMRVNGVLAAMPGGSGIEIAAAQVYGNCPKYIQARALAAGVGAEGQNAPHATHSHELSTAQRHLIATADTFFIATMHAEAGADASHRGGLPGFVRVGSDGALAWPDYAGNTMFQTLGNLALASACGLLFLDFDTGDTLQLTGAARVVWDAARLAEFAGAERLVEFRAEEIVEIQDASPLRWRFVDYSPFNPE